jgi:xanthosine utilization system XapX-like protein
MRERHILIAKLAFCAVLVSAGFGFMVHLLWPLLNVWTMALYVLAGWGILGGLLVVLLLNTAISSWVNQWILRKGGTDTQWLWFPADPPGIQGKRQPKKP